MDSTLESCSKSRGAVDPLCVDKYVKSISRRYSRYGDIDREDLMQDMWVSILRIAPKASSPAILVMEAKQSAIHHLRYYNTNKRTIERSAYRVDENGDILDIEDAYSEAGSYEWIVFKDVVSRFSKHDQDCFNLFAFYGMNFFEIADHIGSSYDKVKRAKNKVKAAVMEALG